MGAAIRARGPAVVAPSGENGDHVVVLDAGAGRFGLLVQRVLGLPDVLSQAIGGTPTRRPRPSRLPPAGQANDLLGATVRLAGALLLVVDVERLGRLVADDAPSAQAPGPTS